MDAGWVSVDVYRQTIGADASPALPVSYGIRKMRVSRVEQCSATQGREHWNAEAMTRLMRRLTCVPNGNSRPLLVAALALVH